MTTLGYGDMVPQTLVCTLLPPSLCLRFYLRGVYAVGGHVFLPQCVYEKDTNQCPTSAFRGL